MKLVSIIVAIYNIKEYVIQCIESILKQSYKAIEIILVDDGSSDGSEIIIDSYKNYANVKIIHKENKGLSSARNKGLDIAKGDYILFVDGDDYVSKTYVTDLISSIMDSDIALCDYFEFDNNGKRDIYHTEIIKTAVINKSIYWKNPLNLTHELLEVSWNKLYKRELFNDLRFDEGKYHEDEFIIHKIIEKCSKITILNKQLYYYRHRESSIMGSYNVSKTLDALEAAYLRFQYYINSGNNFDITSSFKYLFEELCKSYKFNLEKNDINYIKRDFLYKSSIALLNEITKDMLGNTYYKAKLLKKYTPRKAQVKYLSILKLISILNKFKHPRILVDYIKIKSQLKSLEEDTVIFIGSPTYGNLGDQAIALSMINFVKSLNKKIIDIPDIYWEGLKPRINKNIRNTIILVGGGNMGDTYLNEERLRRDVISTFKESKIIIFPQTMFFSNTEKGNFELEITKKIYSNHNNLHIFGREEISFLNIKKAFPKNFIYFCPDIVLWNKQKKVHKKNIYILKIIRNDIEKIDHDKQIKVLESQFNNGLKILNKDTIVNKKVYPWNRKKEIKALFNFIFKSEYVITDRLHGLIFSYLANKKYYALPNYNQKVSGTLKIIESENFKKYYEKLEELFY